MYEVRVLSDTCDPGQQSSYSVALAVVTTPVWCDVVEPRTPPSGTIQPDFTDVSAFVDKFRNAPTAVTMAEIDVNPTLPNQDLNFSDISDVVDSFRGLPYTYSGPVPCP
jgi:hypothetical protein